MKKSSQRAKKVQSSQSTPRLVRAVSPHEYCETPAQVMVHGEHGAHALTRIFEHRDFQIFRDESGRYVVDQSIGNNDPQDAEYGEFKQVRQRLAVSKQSALVRLLIHTIPDDFTDLLLGTRLELIRQDELIPKIKRAARSIRKAQR